MTVYVSKDGGCIGNWSVVHVFEIRGDSDVGRAIAGESIGVDCV